MQHKIKNQANYNIDKRTIDAMIESFRWETDTHWAINLEHIRAKIAQFHQDYPNSNFP